jgi:N-sulfoglucosamine sulfohydrolase
MLFNVNKDPDCKVNLAGDVEHKSIRERLEKIMMEELKRQEDPRVLGQGDVFDNYPTAKHMPRHWSDQNSDAGQE